MSTDQKNRTWQRWLPTPGNIIFTVIAIAVTLVVQQIMAAATNTQVNLIHYQGYLTNSDGTPVNGNRNLSFKLYDAPTGGNLIWGPENHLNIPVTNGLFNIGLGSLSLNGIAVTTDSFLEIIVDGELLSPRESVHESIADGSITSDKLDDELFIPFVPRVVAYVNSQTDITPDQPGQQSLIASLNFTLPTAPQGYRWDIEISTSQRFGAMSNQSVGVTYKLDGMNIKDSAGIEFSEPGVLSMQYSPTDNMIFGGTVYQNNVGNGSHTLDWLIWFSAPSDGNSANNWVLVRQRWMVVKAILVPSDF